MKIAFTSIALFLAMTVSSWDKVTAQNGNVAPFHGECLYTETTCFADDGTPCRSIKQERKNSEHGCGREAITISSKWCNYTNKKRRMFENQGAALTLTGPAATSLNNGNDVTFPPRGIGGDIDKNECQGRIWKTVINTCSAFFNYEVNVFASDEGQPMCRGYNFARQMKSLCKLNGSVSCTILDGSNGGAGTPCEEVQACDYYKGDDKGTECFHDVRYDFKYKNNSNQPVRFDLQGEKVTRALVAWKPVPAARASFSSVMERKYKKTFSHVRERVNVCKTLPSATLNLRANVLDPKTNRKDPDFGFCFNFSSFKVVRFDDNDRTRDGCFRRDNPPTPPSPSPPANPSKGKGGGDRYRK